MKRHIRSSGHPYGSPKWHAAQRAKREKDAAREARVERVLERSRKYFEPQWSAIVLAGSKMPGARVMEGYGNVFNLPDYQGDIVVPGAFDAWLAEYDATRAPIPLLLEHKQDDPDAVLGWAQTLRVDDHGLWARFALLAERGEDVFRRVRTGALSGLSIGYVVDDERAPTWPEKEAGARRVLTAVRVREISLVRTPANIASRVYSVKTREQALVADVRAQLAARAERMTAADQHALHTRLVRVLHDAR